MSGDDKPSRFAMISEEMINPPDLTKTSPNQALSGTRVFTGSTAVFLINGERVKYASGVFGSEEFPNSTDPMNVEVSLDLGGLSWSGEATACPRCKLGAFELTAPVRNQVWIACLGCPPPAPTYILPEGTEVRVNPYRCCRCGNSARVTMTLSEANLHCRACGQLALHTRQDPAPKKPTTSIMSLWADFDKPSGIQSVDAIFENITLGVPFQPKTKSQDINKLVESKLVERMRVALKLENFVERMRVALKLENFVDYAQKRRLLNAELVVQGAYDGNDIARGTGRTTRGLLEALAQCIRDNKREVVVRGGSARIEGVCLRMLKGIMLGIANSSDRDLRIDMVYVKVSRHSDDPARTYRDAIIYVDHTYNGR